MYDKFGKRFLADPSAACRFIRGVAPSYTMPPELSFTHFRASQDRIHSESLPTCSYQIENIY